MVLIIDNYDSFTYNLVQALGDLGVAVRVYRNNRISISRIRQKRPSHLVISPGPKTPQEAGISQRVIKAFAGRIPILGVCLGHQCLVAVFGGKIVRAARIMHGKTSLVYHDRQMVYRGVSNPFRAARYHSLIVKANSLPECFEITAWTKEDEIMGVRHKQMPGLEGVQFHPESFMTPHGRRMLKNFLGYKYRRD